jgi:hypothetical protein
MKKLELKHVKAINLLTLGWSGRDIADELKITVQTLIDWKKDPLFMSNVNRLKMEVLENARTDLQNLSQTAVETLEYLMENGKNEETRRKASIDVLRLVGFEPNQNETFAWGIGSTTYTEMKQDLDGTTRLRELLGDYQ